MWGPAGFSWESETCVQVMGAVARRSLKPSLSSVALVFSERLGLKCRCNDPLSVFFWLSPAVVPVVTAVSCACCL